MKRRSVKGLFQHPQAIAQVCAFVSPLDGSMSDMGMFQQLVASSTLVRGDFALYYPDRYAGAHDSSMDLDGS
jgi:hypothetical protein